MGRNGQRSGSRGVSHASDSSLESLLRVALSHHQNGELGDDALEAAMQALTIRETPETKALFLEALQRS